MHLRAKSYPPPSPVVQLRQKNGHSGKRAESESSEARGFKSPALVISLAQVQGEKGVRETARKGDWIHFVPPLLMPNGIGR